jgi:flagellar basal-body rod modification protein FlgD
MTVSATTPTSQPTPDTSASSAATKSLTENYNTFLTLLTTQLKNQDPLNPMDSSQFTSQLVQFSSVEQQIQQNKNLETLIGAQTQMSANNAVNYIGRTVAAMSDQVSLSNGSATINYALPAGVVNNVITVSDANGKILRVFKGETAEGAHSITWDGKDANGNTMPDGAYKIAISAADASQAAVAASIGISGTVTGVTLIGQQPMLAVGGVTVPLSNVLSVSGTPGSGI